MRTIDGGISIDNGTQATSVELIDSNGKPVEVGSCDNYMVPDLPKGHKEQRPEDWVSASAWAMKNLRERLEKRNLEIGKVLFVIVNGQMHGEVVMTKDGCEPTARLWCDSRNEAEGNELTELFGVKVPTRMTIARWLWTIRNRPEIAAKCTGLTTPAGWVTYRLCGVHSLGIGEASGMFPIDIETGYYRRDLMVRFDSINEGTDTIHQLLPTPCKAGRFIGALNAEGAKILGLPVGTPVAPPEGDQPAVLAGTYISAPGQGGGSWGTSICVNWVSDRPFQGVHPAIDHFCDADGRPINMAWIKNGTTYANAVITLLQLSRGDRNNDMTYAFVDPLALKAPADCGGLRALPLMQIEPATGFVENAFAMFSGIRWEKSGGKVVTNLTPGNMYKAAFLASVFSSRLGLEELRRQGCPVSELTLTGGVLKTRTSTRFAASLIASAMNIPVRVLPGAEEGTAFGGGLLGLFAHRRLTEPGLGYGAFLRQMLGRQTGKVFMPNPEDARVYEGMYRQYQALLANVEPALIGAMQG